MSFESFMQQCTSDCFENLDYCNDPYEAVNRWMPSFTRHVMPRWMKNAIRDAAKKQGLPLRMSEFYSGKFKEFFPPGTFDHWGRVHFAGEDYVISMPYQCHPGALEETANWLGVGFAHFEKSPYAPNAFLLVFWENR